jgi:hypothetical protein
LLLGQLLPVTRCDVSLYLPRTAVPRCIRHGSGAALFISSWACSQAGGQWGAPEPNGTSSPAPASGQASVIDLVHCAAHVIGWTTSTSSSVTAFHSITSECHIFAGTKNIAAPAVRTTFARNFHYIRRQELGYVAC